VTAETGGRSLLTRLNISGPGRRGKQYNTDSKKYQLRQIHDLLQFCVRRFGTGNDHKLVSAIVVDSSMNCSVEV
jgi:hypothetical protein